MNQEVFAIPIHCTKISQKEFLKLASEEWNIGDWFYVKIPTESVFRFRLLNYDYYTDVAFSKVESFLNALDK